MSDPFDESVISMQNRPFECDGATFQASLRAESLSSKPGGMCSVFGIMPLRRTAYVVDHPHNSGSLHNVDRHPNTQYLRSSYPPYSLVSGANPDRSQTTQRLFRLHSLSRLSSRKNNYN
jgi:hypothetical protein